MDGLTELEARVVAAMAAGESVCLGCGCTDSSACAEGCSWILVDRRRAIGLCSQCQAVPGTRTLIPLQEERRDLTQTCLVVIRYPDAWGPPRHVPPLCDRNGRSVPLVLTPQSAGLDALDASEMARLGWVRRID